MQLITLYNYWHERGGPVYHRMSYYVIVNNILTLTSAWRDAIIMQLRMCASQYIDPIWKNTYTVDKEKFVGRYSIGRLYTIIVL